MSGATAIRDAMPLSLREICARLVSRGHRAWVVGGCVRNVLLGRSASDWDVATTASPDEVRRTFRRTVPTGIAHGTVTVLVGRDAYEVTTLRAESGYSDGRRPDEVRFGVSIEEDLGRRDFTVNAIAYDPEQDAIVDPFDGRGDLARRIVRAVRDPMERFAEDGLRPLRAARFVASLEFALDPATEAAIRPNLDKLAKVSAERVRQEWIKAFGAQRASEAFRVMRRTGMLRVLAESLDALAEDAFERAMLRMDAVEPGVPVARLAALVWDLRDDARRLRAWLQGLRFSSREIEGVLLATRHAEAPLDGSMYAARRFLRDVGDDAPWILAVLEAEEMVSANGEPLASGRVAALRRRCEAIAASGDPLDLGALAVKGNDLVQALGRPPGPWLGALLETLMQQVLEDPSLNNRATLIDRAKTWIEREGAPAARA